LRSDSAYQEIEKKCLWILKEHPLNLTAAYFYTISQLKLEKIENLECNWAKVENLLDAIKKSGEGTMKKPYYIYDLEDGKTVIAEFSKTGTKLLSDRFDEESNKGVVTFFEFNWRATRDLVLL